MLFRSDFKFPLAFLPPDWICLRSIIVDENCAKSVSKGAQLSAKHEKINTKNSINIGVNICVDIARAIEKYLQIATKIEKVFNFITGSPQELNDFRENFLSSPIENNKRQITFRLNEQFVYIS